MIFGINENATDGVITNGSGIILVKSIMDELIAAFALFVESSSTVPTHRFPSLSSLMALTELGKERFLADSCIATHTFADNWESIN